MMNKHNNHESKFDFDSEDFNPYEVDKVSRIPKHLKIFIIKAWFAGAMFWLFYMSSFAYGLVPNDIIRFEILAFVLVIVNEYFINTIIKYMLIDNESTRPYTMFSKSKWSLFPNIAYIVIMVFLIVCFGTVILINNDISLSKIFMPGENARWEPIMFGLLYYLFDTLFIAMRNLIFKLIKGKRKKEKVMNDGDNNEV